jgi:hypothetical protein
MKIGGGVIIQGGLNIIMDPLTYDPNLVFNSASALTQTNFDPLTNYITTVTFNANGSISSSPNAGSLTGWYTGTPTDASQFEIAVLVTYQDLYVSDIATGTFKINNVSQVQDVKSSYYPLTSGITISSALLNSVSGDEWINTYRVFIRKIGMNEIIRDGNITDIFN